MNSIARCLHKGRFNRRLICGTPSAMSIPTTARLFRDANAPAAHSALPARSVSDPVSLVPLLVPRGQSLCCSQRNVPTMLLEKHANSVDKPHASGEKFFRSLLFSLLSGAEQGMAAVSPHPHRHPAKPHLSQIHRIPRWQRAEILLERQPR